MMQQLNPPEPFPQRIPGVDCYSIVLKQIAHFNMFTCEIRHVDHPIPP